MAIMAGLCKVNLRVFFSFWEYLNQVKYINDIIKLKKNSKNKEARDVNKK